MLNIKELTVINEMSLTVGLVMLTIGNFLGGMWQMRAGTLLGLGPERDMGFD